MEPKETGRLQGALDAARVVSRFCDRTDRLEPDRLAPEPHHHRDRCGGALQHAARHRDQGGRAGPEDDGPARHHHRRRLRRRRLLHAHLLRPVRPAHGRPSGGPLPDRGARRLHQLFDRSQCRRQRVHRRCGALPRLFGMGARRHPGREALLHRWPDVLARQCHGARSRHRLCAGSRKRHRSIAAVGQSRVCHSNARGADGLRRLGVGASARHRP